MKSLAAEAGAGVRTDEREKGQQAGFPRLETIAPASASRALELRRFSDPGLVEGAAPAPLVAFRCVGTLTEAFGVDDPVAIDPGPHRIPGYLVAVHGRHYIRPLLLASACARSRAGIVLELQVPTATPALWIPGSGDPSTVNGADLICLDNVSIELTGWREEFETLVLEFGVHP